MIETPALVEDFDGATIVGGVFGEELRDLLAPGRCRSGIGIGAVKDAEFAVAGGVGSLSIRSEGERYPEFTAGKLIELNGGIIPECGPEFLACGEFDDEALNSAMLQGPKGFVEMLLSGGLNGFQSERICNDTWEILGGETLFREEDGGPCSEGSKRGRNTFREGLRL